MKKDATVLLQHILESIEAIEEYVQNFTQKRFLDSREKQDAVLRRLEIIGEATKNLPSTIGSEHPDIPWIAIAGMRNKLIHEYFGVDLHLIWEVIQKDLPALKKKVVELINEDYK